MTWMSEMFDNSNILRSVSDATTNIWRGGSYWQYPLSVNHLQTQSLQWSAPLRERRRSPAFLRWVLEIGSAGGSRGRRFEINENQQSEVSKQLNKVAGLNNCVKYDYKKLPVQTNDFQSPGLWTKKLNNFTDAIISVLEELYDWV